MVAQLLDLNKIKEKYGTVNSLQSVDHSEKDLNILAHLGITVYHLKVWPLWDQ